MDAITNQLLTSKAAQNKRILIYSHDGYGLGNIRRNLAICEHLAKTIPDVSILILTGSPMAHDFRIPENVDYVKLPCLTRSDREAYSAKYWDMAANEVVNLRSEVILSTVKHFKPDLVLVDKKPIGIKKEFFPALTHLKVNSPQTKIVLGLRDILDSPESTIPIWQKNQYFEIIQQFYDDIWIFGESHVFDAVEKYQMPEAVAEKVTYTGFLGRDYSLLDRLTARGSLGLNGQPYALVMAGGGGDGYAIMKNYADACHQFEDSKRYDSMMMTGPDMPISQREEIEAKCSNDLPIQCQAFSDSIETYLMASDVVVAMGGYNTICEILSAGKKAVIVPRCRPVQEQFIRALRLEEMGLVKMVHPDELSPATLWEAVQSAARMNNLPEKIKSKIDLGGLRNIERLMKNYFEEIDLAKSTFDFADESVVSEYA
ncbi:MAG: glycosyltransferase family protein [bacterium]